MLCISHTNIGSSTPNRRGRRAGFFFRGFAAHACPSPAPSLLPAGRASHGGHVSPRPRRRGLDPARNRRRKTPSPRLRRRRRRRRRLVGARRHGRTRCGLSFAARRRRAPRHYPSRYPSRYPSQGRCRIAEIRVAYCTLALGTAPVPAGVAAGEGREGWLGQGAATDSDTSESLTRI